MSKDYNHEIGYETLLNDFKVYQNQTPKGITLVRSGKYIKLQFKTPNKTRRKYDCNCTFSISIRFISERRDLNPRPPLPQSGTLPSCATPRFHRLLS
jgi:hypothetical protein